MSSKKPLRAAVYVRLSSHRGEADPSTSPQRQDEASRAYCLAKGWTVVTDTIEDLDVSGSAKGLRLKRPGLERLRALFGEIDVIVFSSLDRLARNVVDFRAFADEAAAHGVALVSVKESLDLTTPSGRFVATILAAFAEMEADVIAERTRGGREGAARALRWAGGIAPYGYKSVPHPEGRGRALIVEPKEAAYLRRASEIVLSGGSLYSAMREISAAGSKPRRAAAWSISSLRVPLTGDATAGRMVHRGEVMRGSDGVALQVWEPVLDYSTILALREALKPEKRKGPRAPRSSRLLSGLLACATCGATLRLQSRGGSKTKAYACRGRTDGTGCTRAVSIGADAVEAYVGATFVERLGDEPETYEIRHEVETGLAELEDALAVALDVVGSAATPEAVSTLQALQTRKAEMLAAPVETTVEVRRTGRTIAEAFAESDVDQARMLLDSRLAAPIAVAPGERGRHLNAKVFAERLRIEWAELPA